MKLTYRCGVALLIALASVLVETSLLAAQEPCSLNAKVLAAVNEMSASVGGTGFPSLTCIDFPGGREVQMNVVDQGGQRWILGVDLASAAPRTRLKVANDRTALLTVSDSAEPRYGTLGT